jgi:hypothetical protein
VCSDIESPERLSGKLHSDYGVSARIEHCAIDARRIPYRNHFDCVLFKSVLGAIGRGDRFDNQATAVREIYEARKANGLVLFAENLSGTIVHQYLKRRLVPWGKDWRYLNLAEMGCLFQRFRSLERRHFGLVALVGRTEKERTLLSLVDDVAGRIVAATWRYIVSGVAIK